MNFDAAFELLIGHEGNYVNDPNDPGGETKFGISKRSFPREDIPNLTLERAKILAKHEFWGPAGCDALPSILRFSVFDCAYNSDPATAVRILQKLVGEFPDGIIGPKTLGAIGTWDLRKLIVFYNLDRLNFMTTLGNWQHHGKGWTRRVIKNIKVGMT